jgi:hypothetical protein
MHLLDISISGRTIPKVDQPIPYKAREVPDFDTATPERLAMGESVVTEDGARQFKDELLVRLADKGKLWSDAKINAALLLAGEKYYADWYGSGMGGLQAIDYGKVRSGQKGSGGYLPPGRIAARCREDYRAARAALPEKCRKVVELILLQDQDLVSAGKAATDSAVLATCRAVAMERFTFGLYLLAKHYVLLR